MSAARPSNGSRQISIAVVGLNFGASFGPIYADHPDVGEVTLCDLDADLLASVSSRYGLRRTVIGLDALLDDDSVEAVHLATGIPDHADQAVRVLDAGKHVACNVPMGLSHEELQRVTEAQRKSGKNYMMMETAVYTREFLFAKDMLDRHLFGDIVYARGTHFQDMTAAPKYWLGLPPMYYMTHAISPILALLDTRTSTVRALGSGRLADENAGPYGRSFPVETAIFALADHPAAVDVTRSLFQIARRNTESFSIYGSRRSFEFSFEWPHSITGGSLVSELSEPRGGGESGGIRYRSISVTAPEITDQLHELPSAVAKYCTEFVYKGADGTSFMEGGGHGGSHPRLVHEFVSSVRDERSPYVDHRRAADWTMAGIAAHHSALSGSGVVDVPAFGE